LINKGERILIIAPAIKRGSTIFGYKKCLLILTDKRLSIIYLSDVLSRGEKLEVLITFLIGGAIGSVTLGGTLGAIMGGIAFSTITVKDLENEPLPKVDTKFFIKELNRILRENKGSFSIPLDVIKDIRYKEKNKELIVKIGLFRKIRFLTNKKGYYIKELFKEVR